MPPEPSTTDSLQYRRLHRTVRPARVATWLPIVGGEQWQHAVLQMLANYSVVWGGRGNILVPAGEDGHVHERLWPLIELFDADLWGVFDITTPGYARAVDPERFGKHVAAKADEVPDQTTEGREAVRQLLNTDPYLSHGDLSDLPEKLVQEIKRRTGAALGYHDQLLVQWFGTGTGPGNDLVDARQLRPSPSLVQLPDVRQLPLSLKVVVAMECGRLESDHLPALVEAGKSVETVLSGDSIDALMSLAWEGRPSRSLRLQRQALANMAGQAPAAEPLLEYQVVGRMPFAQAMAGTTTAQRDVPDAEENLVIVVGDDVNDFCYALALDRCGLPALWLPLDVARSDDDQCVTAVKALTESLQSGGRLNQMMDSGSVKLTSLSEGIDEVEAVGERLRSAPWGEFTEFSVVESIHIPSVRVAVVTDPVHYGEPVDLPFRGDVVAADVPVAVPSEIRSTSGQLTWWTDVDCVGHALPARTALSSLAQAQATGFRPLVRCGSEGVSYFSRRAISSTADALERSAARPQLRFPDARQVFEHMMVELGYEVTESAAGRYRRLTTELWGGLDPLAADLRDPHRVALLHAWLSRRGSGVDPGLLTKSRRRFLSFEDAAKASGLSHEGVRGVLDLYLQTGVLDRGLVLKCSHCLYCEWYRLDEVGQMFLCDRCRTTNRITQVNWLDGTSEPAFHYNLNEVVLQAFEHNSEVPIRALSTLAQRTFSFDHSPELEIRRPGAEKPHLEFDLLAIVNGRIVIGEAKKAPKLDGGQQKQLGWLRKFSKLATAVSADEVIFATSAMEWSAATQTLIEATFTSARPRLRLLTDC